MLETVQLTTENNILDFSNQYSRLFQTIIPLILRIFRIQDPRDLPETVCLADNNSYSNSTGNDTVNTSGISFNTCTKGKSLAKSKFQPKPRESQIVVQ